MTDLAESARLAPNVPELTVSELALAIKRTLEGSFEQVRVRGEVSKPNYHGSGHLYFTLKDEGAVIDGVCWRGTVGRLGLKLEEGMEVIATGRISSFARSSKYQIVIERIELAGEGALLKLLEDRRKRLAAEGLFDPARKKPIPFLPDVIGVVTSPTGAVIRDILHRLADRFPRRVLVWPVPVQGEGAAEKIAAAIDGFNRIRPGEDIPRPDLLIVARGGGSLEDLWAFNEEVVVRAAAASRIPLISAIGHETDTTLIDFAADLRAPTPSAAAEKAVPVRTELIAQILDHERRLVSGLARTMAERRLRLDALARGLPDPTRLLETAEQSLDGETERLANAMRNYLALRGSRVAEAAARIVDPRAMLALAIERASMLGERLLRAFARRFDDATRHLIHAGRMLESLSYRRVLERGFALVRGSEGHPIARAADAVSGAVVAIEFFDATRGARFEPGGADPADAPRRRGRKPAGGGDQGRLL